MRFRSNREADIRRNLVQHGFIEGIIGLLSNLFYGTGIPACIVVVGQKNARADIFMIGTSKGCIKDGNKNLVRTQDIHRIANVFRNQREIRHDSRMVPIAEIASQANDYDRNIPRDIDPGSRKTCTISTRTSNGGIPNHDIDALDAYCKCSLACFGKAIQARSQTLRC